MSKSQREKGMRREREIVARHLALGVRSERVPLSGAADFRNTRATDIDIYPFGRDSAPWVTEVKARGGGGGFALIKRWLGDADGLFLVEDRKPPLVVLPWSRWEEILAALGRTP